MANKQSRHAVRLRELGFEPLDAETEAYINHRTERRLSQANFTERMNGLSRNQRRQMKKYMAKPSFLIIEGADGTTTHATDELGKKWKVDRAVEPSILLKMGFENTAVFGAIAQAMPPLPPEKTN